LRIENAVEKEHSAPIAAWVVKNYQLSDVYIRALTENLQEVLEKKDFTLILDDAFKATLISAFKKAAEEQMILSYEALQEFMHALTLIQPSPADKPNSLINRGRERA